MVSDSLAKPVLTLVQKEKDKDFVNFAQLYLKALDNEDVEPYSAEAMLKILKELWGFTEKRAPGETNIVVTSPLNRKLDWDNQKTSIFIATKERPFLIDSVAAEIMRHNLRIVTLMHPILSIERDQKNYKRQKVEVAGEEDMPQESILFIEVEGSLSKAQCAQLEKDILNVLEDVRYATNDWLDMKAKVLHCIGDLQKCAPTQPDELQKYLDFLQYLHDDNFTLLGYREYIFKREKGGELKSAIKTGSGLGLLRDEIKPAYLTDRKSPLPPEFQELRASQDIITLSKVSRNSTVHRPVPLDGIHIKMHNEKGEVIGERLFIGLFTSVTYSRSVKDVPLLRDKVKNIIQICNFTPNSHDYKALTHIMEKYPRDELFQISEEQLANFVTNIMRLQERPRIALFTREDPFKRYISCLVYIPRDLYSTNIRERFQAILSDELNGKCDTFYTTLDDSPLARVLFIVKTAQNTGHKFNAEKIEEKLIEAGRPWDEKLLQAFISEKGETKSTFRLSQVYGRAFPGNYIERFTPEQAIADIEYIEDVYETGEIGHALYRPKGMDDCQLRLKIYNPERPISLSSVIPIMENMGLRVQSELPFEVKPAEREHAIWIHDMLMSAEEEHSCINIEDVKEVFEEALHKIWYNQAEDDRLNALILSAQLPWRDIAILRAYKKYMRQANFPFTPDYIIRALTDFPGVAAILVDWFKAKHDPANFKKGSAKASKALRLKEKDVKAIDEECWKQMESALEKVGSLDQDRILRSFGMLAQHTLRTNFYQRDEEDCLKSYISLKFNSREIDFLPQPRPAVEVFVYSPRMEGVHLRGGRIARGGIRWSDRHEDFRTEILGLMKAQMVKNSVIVPVGAKGGFIVKQPPKSGDRAAIQEEGIACYKILIRGLLDITDNLNGNEVVYPQSVVRTDDDDPYLVVAADKGTATFSDIANSVSREYNFWLSDAFASGGSAGYDHKEMGITARGAWESVKRHFRELGHDTQSEDFDVVGVGDMGGDVFGNGMLLSKHIRLIGAFNHLHIFCDPNPDTVKSFKERKRLFEEVKGWGDYNEKLLSKGGRIFNRSDKSLTLTDEIKKRFDIKDDKVSPIELIRAMLKARADLLWFGGIGTYIKSSEESQLDVGDKANDALRIEAEQVRARVVGEGANLGITQKARIEMAMHGVKLNADFIDNSGGVDCSDHEVNIKIMLSQYMQNNPKKLSLKARNKLLEEMTENVAGLVLESNYQQTQAISLADKTAVEDLRLHSLMIQELEKSEGLNRALETLPDDEDIDQRLKEQKGLTRPELATLIAYSKIRLYNDLLSSNVPDDNAFDNWLSTYFPKQLQEKYQKSILHHKLRREIVATRLTNAIVNRFGPTFIMNLVKKSDAYPHEAARACFFIRETFRFKSLWTAIEDLDNKVSADTQLDAILDIKNLTEHATLWFLKKDILGEADDIETVSKRYRDGFTELKKVLQEDCMPQGIMTSLATYKKRHIKNGMPEKLATEISMLPLLRSSCDITYLAHCEGYDVAEVAQIYHTLGSHLNIQWLHEQARQMQASNKWQEMVLQTIQDELYDIHAQICGAVLTCSREVKKNKKIEHWIDLHGRAVMNVQRTLAEMQRHSAMDLSMLTMAEQRLRRLTNFEG